MLIGFVLLVVLGFGLPYLYAVYVTYKKTKSDELWKKNSIERNTPVFRPGTCIASRSEILGVPINYEVFEEVPVRMPQFRIEAVGKERYFLRSLPDGHLITSRVSFAEINYINIYFEEVPCPDYLKDVPLCAVATKKEVVRND